MLLTLGAGCAPSAGPSPPIEARPFANIDNTPFATRTLGPKGALLYEPRSEAPGDMRAALSARTAQAGVRSDRLAAARRFPEMLARHTRKSPGTAFMPNRRAVPIREGRVLRPSVPEAGARQAGGELTFSVTGFSGANTELLEDLIDQIYPIVKQFYGAPAFAHQVSVELDPALRNFAEGVYDAGTDTIFLAPLSDNDRNTAFALTRHMLHAMRDDAMLLYDAWEDGHVLAVANLVMASVYSDWDPTLERSEYSLNLYELMNRPELGNDSIWETGFPGLIVTRLALSSGAWMKLLVEDPLAMVDFNSAYYAAFDADPDVAGDVPRLKAIMAAIVPAVEGRSFYDWFRLQYALDTSLTVGQRMYVGMIPTFEAVALFVTHTTTTPEGVEEGLGGRVALEFWDYTHQFSLFVQEGYEIPIPESGGSAGIGEYSGSLFNIGGQQRITIDLALPPMVQHILYPYNSRREDLDLNADPQGINLYGAIDGRDDGKLTVAVGEAEAEELEYTQGSFRGHVGDGFLSPGKLRLSFEDVSGETIERQINVGYFDYAIVDAMEKRGQLTHTFVPPQSGLMLVSFPGWPVGLDESEVLGLDREDVLLAAWDPQLAAEDKYRLYPHLPAIEPGRGYWLKAESSVPVEFNADALTLEETYRVHLEPGWNLIGLPYAGTVSPNALRFDRAGASASFSQAVQNGWVRSIFFGYDPLSGGYQETQTIRGWEGVWVRCIVADGCNIAFGGTTTQATSREARAPAAQRIRSAGGSAAEIDVVQGDARARLVLGRLPSSTSSLDLVWDVEALPPPPGSTLRASVDSPSGPLGVDVRPGGRRLLHIASQKDEAVCLEVASGEIELDGGVVLGPGDGASVPHMGGAVGVEVWVR
ncbi:MAG: hypothetical protein GF320_06760 [Armatimonadia bacterium]|nr:hypothetical protein [Armatimonadia bacterium]